MSTQNEETRGAGQPKKLPLSPGQPIQESVSLAQSSQVILGAEPSALIGYTPNPSGTKRSRSGSDELLCSPNTVVWPRFLVISSLDPNNTLSKLTPFAVEAGIKGIASTPKTFKKLVSGDILIEVGKKCYSDNLMNSAALVNIPIRVAPHRTLNYSRGVIRCTSLNICTEQELLDGLESQGVLKARCCMRKNSSGVLERSGTYFLKFNSPDLPNDIKICFENIPVKPYVPNPLRCYNCQLFGHSKTHCKKQTVCAKCAEEGHTYETCQNPPKCRNCEGPHASSDKTCRIWILEKEIQAYKTLNNVSFKEAREVVSKRTPGGAKGQSYAAIVQEAEKARKATNPPQTVQMTTSATQTSTESDSTTDKIIIPFSKSTNQQTFANVVSSPGKPSQPTPSTSQEKPSKPPCTNMTTLTKDVQKSKQPSELPKKATNKPRQYNSYTGGIHTKGSRSNPLTVEGKKEKVQSKLPAPSKSTVQTGGAARTPSKQKTPDTTKKKKEPPEQVMEIADGADEEDMETQTGPPSDTPANPVRINRKQ